MYDVYQPLVFVNETSELATGSIVFTPGLAQNWTTSPDYTTFTFHLRQHINFSNGDPFNAYQVWMQMYGQYYVSAYSNIWDSEYPIFNMANASSFGPSTVSLINSSGGLINPTGPALNIMKNSSWPIYVTDPYTIVFHLSAPFLWLPSIFATEIGQIWDSQYILDNGGFGTPSAINSYFDEHGIPGTGPYMVSGISFNSYIKFTQNPTYWGNSLSPVQISQQPLLDPGHVKNIVVNYKPDDLSRYTDLASGAADISAIQSQDWNLVNNNPVFSYFKTPPWSPEASMLGLNTQLYPTNITDVRQAIVHAINYSQIYNQAWLGHMTPYVGPEYPAWNQFYDLGNFTPYQYNVSLAMQDIAAANLTNPPTLNMIIQAGCSACTTAAQVIQQDLGVIGLNVNIEVLAPSSYIAGWYVGSFTQQVADAAKLGHLNFDFGGLAWAPGALTPADYWVTFVSNQSTNNFALYNNPTVQACDNAFTSSSNVSYIQSVCRPAQAQIYKDAPYAWIGVNGLWEPSGGSLVWKNSVIKGFLADPLFTGEDWSPFFNTVIFAS